MADERRSATPSTPAEGMDQPWFIEAGPAFRWGHHVAICYGPGGGRHCIAHEWDTPERRQHYEHVVALHNAHVAGALRSEKRATCCGEWDSLAGKCADCPHIGTPSAVAGTPHPQEVINYLNECVESQSTPWPLTKVAISLSVLDDIVTLLSAPPSSAAEKAEPVAWLYEGNELPKDGFLTNQPPDRVIAAEAYKCTPLYKAPQSEERHTSAAPQQGASSTAGPAPNGEVAAAALVRKARAYVAGYASAPGCATAANDLLLEIDTWLTTPTRAPVSAIELTTAEAQVIKNLITLADFVERGLEDGAEELPDGSMNIDEAHSNALCLGLAVLDTLPDDKPGVTLCGPGRALWALRRLLPKDTERAPIVSADRSGER